MFVAIPTAIPDEPFAKRFGKRVGITRGSTVSPLYVEIKSTASSLMPSTISMAAGERRASVYRIAAALSPSMLPKLP